MSGLGVETESVLGDRGVMVRLSGELDIYGAQVLRERLIELDRSPPPLLVLDLRGLEFVDSSGLRIILAADDTARRDGRRVALIEGPSRVQSVFETTRLDERLHFVEHPEELSRAAP